LPSVSLSARRLAIQGYAKDLLEELAEYRSPAAKNNGHALLYPKSQTVLDKILGPQWRGGYADVIQGERKFYYLPVFARRVRWGSAGAAIKIVRLGAAPNNEIISGIRW
jgi:hypothetical protein